MQRVQIVVDEAQRPTPKRGESVYEQEILSLPSKSKIRITVIFMQFEVHSCLLLKVYVFHPKNLMALLFGLENTCF